MTTDEELQSAVEALSGSVFVAGAGDIGRAAADRIVGGDLPATDSLSSPDAVVVALDASEFADGSVPELPPLPESSVRIAVVTLPDRPVGSERELLSALVDRVGTVVLASGTGPAELTEAVETLVSTVHESGIVNIDLADAQTVFRSADVAALCLGDDPDCDPAAAVRAAFGGLPNGIETDPVRGVLVDVVGAPGMSVGDISDAVSTVREHVGPDAHVIWGGTVEADREGMGVRLVLAGVKHTRVVPGDHCPRCGASLSAYTLGDRTTLSCESCGFAGVSVRLRE